MRRRAIFERLGGVLEAKKSRDAAELGLVQAEIATLDDERARLEAQLASVATAGSLSELAALERWRAATRERIQDLAMARAELETLAEERRRVLARSNGEREAAKRLVQDLPPKR